VLNVVVLRNMIFRDAALSQPRLNSNKGTKSDMGVCPNAYSQRYEGGVVSRSSGYSGSSANGSSQPRADLKTPKATVAVAFSLQG
jgi:hypothetical protein